MAIGRTYVIFDGDTDGWAYQFMRGWKANDRVEFEFSDAHDLGSLTSQAQNEAHVKGELRKRLNASKQVVVLVGEHTKFLRKYVPWEIDIAVELDLPVIVVNLNGSRSLDSDLCPVALRTGYHVHISFKREIIRYALENFPTEYARRDRSKTAARFYNEERYRILGCL
jgi:hypothetical protein